MDPEEGDDLENEDFDELDEPEGEEPEAGEGEEDPLPEEEADQDEPPARKPSRAQARIEELDRRTREFERVAQEAATRAEAAERRLAELSGPSRADAERREQERLAAMDPWDRAQYLARQSEQRTTSELGSLRAQIADSTDRSEFAAACAGNPSLAKVKDQVEAELTKLRATGQTVPRQTLATYLIGQSVLEKAPKARERAAKRARGNLDRERARPAGGASDTPRGRDGDDRTARDKRLENYTF
jgi:hypothetical protein